jgi:hypothetical protein
MKLPRTGNYDRVPEAKAEPFVHLIRWLRDLFEGRPQVTTEYPRRKPNPIVHLIRWLWGLFVIALIVSGIIVLYGMLEWWNVPIVLAFGYCTYILFRNRRRRASY